MASNAATRKVQPINRRTTTVRSSTVKDLELGCHKSVLFYAFVEPKQHKRKIVLNYLDPPVHDSMRSAMQIFPLELNRKRGDKSNSDQESTISSTPLTVG